MNTPIAREYSKRLGTLSLAQFQAALDRFDLGTFVSAEPIPFGNFGQNVFLTSTKGEYVLRGAPHYPWQFPKERFFTLLLHERTPVPVPWPYLLDPGDGIFGWSYVLMPRMPGLLLIDPKVRRSLSIADRRAIAGAMGTTLAHMHSLTWSCAGEYDLATDTIRPLGADHAEWIISRMRHDLQLSIPLSDRTTDADVEWAERLIAQGREALGIPFVPCFVMQDFKEGNAVAERGDSMTFDHVTRKRTIEIWNHIAQIGGTRISERAPFLGNWQLVCGISQSRYPTNSSEALDLASVTSFPLSIMPFITCGQRS